MTSPTADQPTPAAEEPTAPGDQPAATAAPGERSETELERYDRNLTELMGELRVALPGVQVLFGFLLVIPFDTRFKAATGAERGLYFATLALTLMTSALLIAPTMVHRLTFSQGKKQFIVRAANRLAVAGLTTLALALTGAIAFVTGFVFGTVAAFVTAAVVACVFGVLWYLLPLRGR